MNKRLVWNFEINPEPIFTLPDEKGLTDEHKWEIRFFWPADTIIELKGLSDSHLDLSRYTIKHREDRYCLLKNHDLNIKVRRGRLLYKPILARTRHAIAYGKKIDLLKAKPHTNLPGDNGYCIATLLNLINTHKKEVVVRKEALIYQFKTQPKIKLELARLEVNGVVYFSVCVESYALALTQSLSRHLLNNQLSCDYITFLKHLFFDD